MVMLQKLNITCERYGMKINMKIMIIGEKEEWTDIKLERESY